MAEPRPLDLFARKWECGGPPPDIVSFLEQCPNATPEERGAIVLFDQEKRRELQQPVPAEQYLQLFPDLPTEVKLSLMSRELALHEQRGESQPSDAVSKRFSLLREEGRRLLDLFQESQPTRNGIEPGTAEPFSSREWVDAVRPEPDLAEPPRQIDKYPVKRLLNTGGFKRVYLSRHEALGIDVVIKIPHPHIISTENDVLTFLSEARTLATLDHPAIVRVYDAGRTAEGLCYVVERFVDGTDLEQKLKEGRPGHQASAELVATVADALHHVHLHGLVHRDIKPANILIDSRGNPVVTDFGLALRNEDFGKGPRQAGTVAYMSPEQARAEGHLVDGRTDIYSLGVVLYRTLTGELPVRGSPREALHQIRTVEARPPRQIDDTIPKELERICLRALAKRASERYSTASDMAEDLRSFLAGPSGVDSRSGGDKAIPGGTPLPSGTSTRDREPERGPPGVPRIVLRGLRSFEETDADFFLELLPGPRDRGGLPSSVRFWKELIEATDLDRTFRVAILYGPSGCGKSSLVKAGLLPRLAGNVKVVFVEASPAAPASTLLRILGRKLPGLNADLSLADAFASLRRGKILPVGQKLVIVIDQFEQWMHAGQTGDLVEALRQCDGEHLQCLLLVRDDFWMAVTRFMHELEIPLVEGRNCASVDLFDPRHARKVLTAFGRACGSLPETGSLTADQTAFVDRALADLAEDDHVIPVRLVLFAEMLKARAWARATLRQVRGTHGVGVRFLEETFCESSAPPSHRVHERAARGVLASLLPLPDSAIKGHSRSWNELLEASGYKGRPASFEELMRILDNEVRLLTPVDPEMLEPRDGSTGEKRYQLTHDYLVPPLREWLTAKQRETRRGRAALLLADRADVWNAQPTLRRLPSLPEWLRLLALTPGRQWTAPQRRMMRSSSLFHSARILIGVVLVVLLLGQQVLESWRVASGVAAARSAWTEGPERWGEACEHLEQALALAPRDARAEALLRTISQTGYLIVHTLPEDAEVHVTPQPGEGKKTDLKLEPRHLEGAGPFRPGQRIRLTPGHYWVEVKKAGISRQFPVFVSQVLYADAGDWWREARRLLPVDVAAWEPTGPQAVPTFRLAEGHVVGPVVLSDIPPGYALVPPGPFYCSAGWNDLNELEGPPEREWFKLRGSVAKGIVSATLQQGFLIAKDEVPVASFADWFHRFRNERREWILSRWMREVSREAIGVPVDVLTKHWQKECAAAGAVGEAPATREALFRTVASARARKNKWLGDDKAYEEQLEASLKQQHQNGDTLPVVDVSRYYAVLYARTHPQVDPRALEPWLAGKAAAANKIAGELVALREELRKQGELFDLDALPQSMRISRLDHGGRLNTTEVTLLGSYVEWLYWGIQFAAQAPRKAVVLWANANREVLSVTLRERLEEITASLGADPWLDLHTKEAEACLTLVHAYAMELEKINISSAGGKGLLPSSDVDRDPSSSGRIRLERDNFLLWLETEIETARSSHEELLMSLREVVGHSQTPGSQVAGIPFEVRLLYGTDLGWDIPSWDQWEKTYRGADARRHPWGNGVAFPNVARASGGPRSTEIPGDDVSPHGVSCLAGNVSEWVWGPDENGSTAYLRGGNWYHAADWGRADRLLGAARYGRGTNAGFRVVRTLPLETQGTER